ncbi:alpha/beta fold hydrolase [Chitinispirillales bacterium ANBcel5]|uniref:alpha/beta fold hydrolase n=1 Tax=Cellulosispirillum alkaliphilum TaxID=3039283 RepID=UPI002A531E45|nr:alpha/beta fold hydrolase [Chitinispirillales bacterium ANBcel5]
MMSTFLLVHGGSIGGWCWHKVKNCLEQCGHRVYTPDLPGHESDFNGNYSEITFEKYVHHITNQIRRIDSRLILVGHSLGGAVITKVLECIDSNLVQKVIYVCAMVPANGGVIGKLLDAEQELKKVTKIDKSRMCIDLLPGFWEVVFNRCSSEDITYAQKRIVPQPLLPLSVPISIKAKGAIKKIGIVCNNDLSLSPKTQETMYKNAGCELKTLDSGHAPYFSHAKELSAILMND